MLKRPWASRSARVASRARTNSGGDLPPWLDRQDVELSRVGRSWRGGLRRSGLGVLGEAMEHGETCRLTYGPARRSLTFLALVVEGRRSVRHLESDPAHLSSAR